MKGQPMSAARMRLEREIDAATSMLRARSRFRELAQLAEELVPGVNDAALAQGNFQSLASACIAARTMAEFIVRTRR